MLKDRLRLTRKGRYEHTGAQENGRTKKREKEKEREKERDKTEIERQRERHTKGETEAEGDRQQQTQREVIRRKTLRDENIITLHSSLSYHQL